MANADSINQTVRPAADVPASIGVAVLVGNEVTRRGLESILNDLSGVAEVSYHQGVAEAQAALATGRVDVLLVTSSAGREALSVAGGGARILVLVDDGSGVQELFGAAARPPDGIVLLADLTPDGLAEALHRTATGQIHVPDRLARELMDQARVELSTPVHPARLTARESEAMGLMAEGMSNKQIAGRLGISSHGAKRLVASLMLKLGSPNRTAAVVNAIKSGLVR
ncbi:two-component system response regulator [Micromonospora sp. ATCC 39149]|uniref:Response regulator transcription factor n=1 Tax=Micromonospora carbonacea TaxID=47853 RepID=A0A7D6GAB3_9ACTN|nr:response regulator transcription factor [Micromonospora sp. ATCC 39149]EEP75240.1 two-component system response regulator [Micromonospora sp. ATCC 39149]QLK00963.1 response regulator transcription factor [Micromonospora carbonacea]